jgi:ketosteroid isomerase-like protein
MHPNQTRLDDFYAAFARLDADTMASFYAPDAQFHDEAFSLRGHEKVGGMWRMLCDAAMAGDDIWKLAYSGIEADAHHGQAHWEADYRFGQPGRRVHNVVHAVFQFNEQGLITHHKDRFNFWAWSSQALGAPGLLLGWTPFLRRKVEAQAAANLQKYLSTRGAAAA